MPVEGIMPVGGLAEALPVAIAVGATVGVEGTLATGIAANYRRSCWRRRAATRARSCGASTAAPPRKCSSPPTSAATCAPPTPLASPPTVRRWCSSGVGGAVVSCFVLCFVARLSSLARVIPRIIGDSLAFTVHPGLPFPLPIYSHAGVGRWLATASDDATIVLWARAEGGAAAAPVGNLVGGGGDDGDEPLESLEHWAARVTLRGHSEGT
jgi:hypothetical protein